MKIALDFDGVLSHTMKRWVAIYNGKPNKHADITIRDINEWAFFENWGMSVDECFEIFDECWNGWENLEPMEQDQWQKTKMLCNIGEVDIVTTVNESALPSIEKWLKHHDIRYNKIVHSKKKHELNYDVYIDDSPKNILEMEQAGKNVLAYNQPWNRHIKDSHYVTRVYNLYHAIDVLRSWGD